MTIDCSKCPEGWSGCCGCTPMDPKILEKHYDKIQRKILDLVLINNESVPLTEDFKCTFLSKENKCLIYEDRPQVCKDFGTNPGNTPLLMCPYFKPTGGKRRPSEIKHLKKTVEAQIESIKRHQK